MMESRNVGFSHVFFLQYKDLIIGDSMGDLGLRGNKMLAPHEMV